MYLFFLLIITFVYFTFSNSDSTVQSYLWYIYSKKMANRIDFIPIDNNERSANIALNAGRNESQKTSSGPAFTHMYN